MAELKRYLYDGLSYRIDTGVKPMIVRGSVVQTKQTVPRTTWEIDFGVVNHELKNAIEASVFNDPNDLYIRSYIGPGFMIGRFIDLSGNYYYYLTYWFEYQYYNNFVIRPLEFTVDGTDHLIEGQIRIPITWTTGDPVVIVSKPTEFKRKLFFTDTKLNVTHKANGTFSMKGSFVEQARPLPYSGLDLVGASNDSYAEYC